MELILEAFGFTGLKTPGHDPKRILIVEPSQMATTTGWAAVATGITLEELAEKLGASVSAQGSAPRESGGEVPWIELTIDGNEDDPVRCEYSPTHDCAPAFATAGFNLDLPTNTIIRIAAPPVDAIPLMFITFGDSESSGWAADVVVDMATTAASSDEPSESPTQFMGALGSRRSGLPIGKHVAPIAESMVTFTFETEVENWQVPYTGFRTIGFSAIGPQASLFLTEFDGLIDPETAQLPPPDFPTGFLSEAPVDVEGADRWLRQLVAVVDSGDTELGGRLARWWNITVDDSIDASRCGPERWLDPEAQCVTYMANELAYLQPEGIVGRVYYVPEAHIWLTLRQEQPDLTFDELLEMAAPILDSMTITGG